MRLLFEIRYFPLSKSSGTDSEDEHDGDDSPAVPERAARAARSPSVPPSAAIRVQQDNPKRFGSKSHQRFDAYKSAKTKQQFLDLGGTTADFAYDVSKGYVVLI